MSPTYTTWIHHGEEGGGTDIIEPSNVHGSHHDGWIAEEEEQETMTVTYYQILMI